MYKYFIFLFLFPLFILNADITHACQMNTNASNLDLSQTTFSECYEVTANIDADNIIIIDFDTLTFSGGFWSRGVTVTDDLSSGEWYQYSFPTDKLICGTGSSGYPTEPDTYNLINTCNNYIQQDVYYMRFFRYQLDQDILVTSQVFKVDNGIATLVPVVDQPIINFSSTLLTNFTDFSYTYNTISTTTAEVTLTAEYFLELDELSQSDISRFPQFVTFSILDQDDEFLPREYVSIPFTQGTSTAQHTINLQNGQYDVLIRFHNLGAQLEGLTSILEYTNIYSTLIIEDGAVTSSIHTSITQFTPPTLNYGSCSLTNLDVCFKNIFSFIFVPSFGLDYFTSTVDNLKTKVPFNYLFSIVDQFQGISAQQSSLPVIAINYQTFPEVTVLNANNYTEEPWNSVFSFVRTLSITFIYASLIIVLYRRTRIYVDSLVGSPQHIN